MGRKTVTQRQQRLASADVVEQLTPRELDILALLARRLSNKEIASQLSIAPGTVNQHINHLYRKLGVSNRRAAVLCAEQIGLL